MCHTASNHTRLDITILLSSQDLLLLKGSARDIFKTVNIIKLTSADSLNMVQGIKMDNGRDVDTNMLGTRM